MNENVEYLANFSIAYRAGMEAKKLGIPIEKTAIKNLRHGTPQYDDFLAGYDSYELPPNAESSGAPTGASD